MITFVVCLTLLVVSYFTYAKYLERIVGIKATDKVPSETHFDGVDYVPMPRWKTFLIQLLNIAGLGPIFGAVLGATYGPVAFLWITLGGIFFGAMHDYISGVISVHNGGINYPDIIGKYLGQRAKGGIRVFTIALMLLVGAVFMVGPAGILTSMTSMSLSFWVVAILAYYFLATLLPIDALIGRIYPLFGAALLFMALGVMCAMFFEGYAPPELTLSTLSNMKSDPSAFPILPTLFITIACGAISGFHATQSPLMARCVKNTTECRATFFGAMIAESIIAMIWAAIAMAFFGGVEQLNTTLAEHNQNAAWVVDVISKSTLGKIGGILALLGVVAAPITTGDTAFRSARLILADLLGIGQRQISKRLLISIPLFVIGFGITLLEFDVVWRYFAWTNQTLAAATLWAITIYLRQNGKNIYIALIPALFMTFITSAYLFTAGQMMGLGRGLGLALSAVVTIFLFILFLRNGKTKA